MNYNLRKTKKYGLDFLYHGAQSNYGTCYQITSRNIKFGHFKASIRNWNEPMCKCVYVCAITAVFSTN